MIGGGGEVIFAGVGAVMCSMWDNRSLTIRNNHL